MAYETNMQDEVAQLRRSFDEFRNTLPLRSRLPEPLRAAAAELATRYGVGDLFMSLIHGCERWP
jgi:hypothetical protein